MSQFKALLVSQVSDKQFESAIVERQIEDLPAGEVLIQVHYSSLNYKDALSANGHPEVTKSYPHTPGIDAAGVVQTSEAESFKAGDEVIVTGYDLGMNTAGGFGQYIRVPAAWVIKKPDGLTLRDSMVLGTAGLTAALCIDKLQRMGLSGGGKEVLVTGASGGVGSLAIALLHKLGYEVIASTGKLESAPFLNRIGATQIIDRNTLSEASKKPLLRESWDAAIDTVGGATLANVLKSIRYDGSVACCGLVQSPQFDGTVLPFILRNINLLGIDSVELPPTEKLRIWQKLATEWKLDDSLGLSKEITLTRVAEYLDRLYRGQATGRIIVNLLDQ